ncbi:MAG TPA: GTP cyclohydrolase II [Acidimicrobiales bacterium]|nr:GTP cyclohydrolase II [Acidimicrobiales bacterium]
MTGPTLVRHVAQARIPTTHGAFTGHAYRSADGHEHVALVYGDLAPVEVALARVHSECLTGDVFGSLRCDCGPQLDFALARIVERGAGVVVYLRGHEGRGIGLGHKLAAYELQDAGADTVEANERLGLPVDDRRYDVAAWILADVGAKRVELLTNNPAKRFGLEANGIEVCAVVSHVVAANPLNEAYLRTKRDRLGHHLP